MDEDARDLLAAPFVHPSLEVARALDVDVAAGLAGAEAERRAASAGPNELEAAKRESVLGMVLETLTEPFLLVLVAAGVLAILLGEVRDGILILLALGPIVGADVVTEYRADRALDAIREASAPTARVRRGGAVAEIHAAGLVPGDVVLLRVGDIVPADLRLTRADSLSVDRSALTGESVPEAGSIEPDPPDSPLTARHSMAYSGTSIVGGRGEGVVVAIGTATEFGRIAQSLSSHERRRSPLQAELDRLVKILLGVAIALIAITVGLGFARGNPAGENLLAGISAAVAAIPEEPPILLAVILGLGAYRLLKRNVLVRRLNAQETLGSIDLILTDKTGTLTRNRLEVQAVETPAGLLEGAPRLVVLLEALRAEDDAWGRADGAAAGSFTQSLVRAIEAAGGDTTLAPADLIRAEPVQDGHPVCRTRSRGPEGVADLAIGAPETVLALVGDGVGDRAAWDALLDRRTATGERVVALAARQDGSAWTMRALIGFADPIRDGIREALGTAREAGVEVIVVTGDHPRTAAAIATEAGLDGRQIVLGEELSTWDDARVTAALSTLAVVARSAPDQKERLVRLARAAGRTVAVTGDGVNDAPALNGADVAVAMGSGTAVAKEAADLVLGDDSFATLMYGLAEGRRIVDNVEKGLIFLISTHVALLGFILIATLYGFGQPLFPIQILWLELFIDLSTSVAFELEGPEPDLMRRKPRPRGLPLLTNGLLARIGVAGGFSAVAALVAMIAMPGTLEHRQWLAFTILVCGQAVRANANRSLRTPFNRLPINWFLLVVGALVIAIQAVIPYVPVLADAFRASPLDRSEWAIVAIVALAPAVLAQLVRTTTGRAWVA